MKRMVGLSETVGRTVGLWDRQVRERRVKKERNLRDGREVGLDGVRVGCTVGDRVGLRTVSDRDCE
jgi:hypothetical protein